MTSFTAFDTRPAKARGQLDVHIKALTVIADWKEDFDKRLERAQLRRIVVGVDVDELHDLEVEATEFKQVCQALIDSLKQRGPAA